MEWQWRSLLFTSVFTEYASRIFSHHYIVGWSRAAVVVNAKVAGKRSLGYLLTILLDYCLTLLLRPFILRLSINDVFFQNRDDKARISIYKNVHEFQKSR